MRAALDPDNTSIMVCGGAGTAMHTTRKLKDMGAWVWMMQRSDNNRAEIEKMMAFQVKGDAMDAESVKKAMASAPFRACVAALLVMPNRFGVRAYSPAAVYHISAAQMRACCGGGCGNGRWVHAGIDDLGAVVSTVGGTTENPQVDGEGNINIINAAVEAGVKKFVLVTSIGTGDSKDAPGEQVYNVLKPVLLEKVKAEEALKARPHALRKRHDVWRARCCSGTPLHATWAAHGGWCGSTVASRLVPGLMLRGKPRDGAVEDNLSRERMFRWSSVVRTCRRKTRWRGSSFARAVLLTTSRRARGS